MRTMQRAGWLRAAGMGVLFACLGFSVALATCESRGLPVGLTSRLISGTYQRPPTEFVTDADLGVVVIGTQFTRQIIVRYGFKPHVFLLGAQKAPAGISLSEGGLVAGKKADLGKESFEVRVIDASYRDNLQPVSKTFSITGVDSLQSPQLALQFVNKATLPVAVANEPYSFTIHANGGQPPYTFSLVSDADFAALPQGISFNAAEARLSGKPTVPTTTPAAFTVQVRDDIGTLKTQTFYLTVLPGTIKSEFVATSGNFTLMFGKEKPRDTLMLILVLDKTELAAGGIRNVSDLAGMDFTMDFGGVTIPPDISLTASSGQSSGGTTSLVPKKFDKNGKMRFPDMLNGIVPLKGTEVEYEIKLNPRSGVLTVKVRNLDLITGLGAMFKSFGASGDPAGPVIPVAIRLGTAATAAATTTTDGSTTTTTDTANQFSLDKTDIVKFEYKRRGGVGRGTARRNDRLAPGGLFMVTKVQGTERQVRSSPGQLDQLFLKVSGFLRKEGDKAIEPGANDQVAVLFGTVCLGYFPALQLNPVNGKLVYVNTENTTLGLHSIVIDNNKRTFVIETNGLDPRALFGADILVAGVPLIMPVTLTIQATGAATATFDGQSSVTLFRKGNSIRNK